MELELELTRFYGQWRLQDCRLSHNRLPPEDLVKKLSDFGWHYNVLSERPGRMGPTALRSRRTKKKVRTLPADDQVETIQQWLGDQVGIDAGDLGTDEIDT